MKKLFVVLGLVMLAFSFQAGAATLSLTNLASGNTTTGTNLVSGQETVKAVNTASFLSAWTFETNKTGDYKLNVSSSSTLFYITEIILNGVTIGKQGNKLDKVFTLSFLKDTVYDIIVYGSLKRGNEADINVGVSSVPVPAAVWLFGSALMGLMGATRRKNAIAA